VKKLRIEPTERKTLNPEEFKEMKRQLAERKKFLTVIL
jgi:hypothetical protein